jgi:transcriptional regulator with XRE-family HTH domain
MHDTPLKWRMCSLLEDAMATEGLNQTAFAGRMGLSRQRVSAVLRREPALDTLDRWAQAMGWRWEVQLVKDDDVDQS